MIEFVFSDAEEMKRMRTAGRAWTLALALGSALGVANVQAATVSARLESALAADRSKPHKIWVYFADKGSSPKEPALSPRALWRRAHRGAPGAVSAAEDQALDRRYVENVASRVSRVRNESRWLNAVSVEASADQVRSLVALPFVVRLDLVRGYRGRPERDGAVRSRGRTTPGELQPQGLSLDYGISFLQLDQIGIPSVHNLGLHGEGTVIAVFDAGFNNLAHSAFATTRIVARHDFVNGDEDVGDGFDRGEGSHGTGTLSVLGGFRPGELIGPAYAAEFLLAKTEDTDSETPIEEDNWAAAAEWAEALGADVVSSSLGYLSFDPPFASYSSVDMNGSTAVTTLAADRLAARGVVVVTSAGNAGFDPTHNTLGAPADGRQVLSVGAVGWMGERAAFSSVGPTADGRTKPDVAALGVFVTAASATSSTDVTFVSGTSFSCPLAAGTVALLLQAHPEYRVDQVLAVLRSTARQSSAPDNLLGWGVIDVLAAVSATAPSVVTTSAR